MKVISVINLKGGVAKTISSINVAYILMAHHGAKVLLIDNDKQGNTSKFFGLYCYDMDSIADVLTKKDYPIGNAIQNTKYDGLDILPANMTLLRANKEILMDVSRPQQTRLKKALNSIVCDYDFVVIDNAPDLNMSVINALVASQDVIIPIKIDKFAFDGLDILIEQIEDVKEFNPDIRIAGCIITMFQQNTVNRQGEEYLRNKLALPVFNTAIRKTVKVDETTFAGVPLAEYASKSTAAKDYTTLVDEYLNGVRI